MNKNKEILKHCPNFRKIVEFDYLEDDNISEKLINFYTDFIFSVDLSNETELLYAKQIDKVLEQYIEDYNFRKEMKHSLKTLKVKSDGNVLKSIIESILKIFDLYIEQTMTKKIYVTRWI